MKCLEKLKKYNQKQLLKYVDELSKEQQNAYNKIVSSTYKREFKEFLIYGVTGSRKNRNLFTTY